jgi:GNAT superfamily N-acetyltransferase
MTSTEVRVTQVKTQRQLRQFVTFPWRIYRGDRNWVPPLISRRLAFFDRSQSPFFQEGNAAPFLALRDDELVGTIAPAINFRDNEQLGRKLGVFGFFECVEDYGVACALFDAACGWLRERGMTLIRGPYNFGNSDDPGFLIGGEDCPPVMLEAHTKPYYAAFAERYGMCKFVEDYAYRIDRRPVANDAELIPERVVRVAEYAQKRAGVTVRQAHLDHWDDEIPIARRLFNTALTHLTDFIPLSEEQFRHMALEMKPLLDPELVYFAEVNGEPVAFSLALPDLNRVLIHGNGGRYPWDWMRMWWASRHIDVISFKIMVMLPEYHGRGLDAILYVNTAKAALRRGYRWMDMSLVAEENTQVRLLVEKMGGRIFKRYRVYEMAV